MNQGKLAKKLGIPRSYLNGILRGKRQPGVRLAEKIVAETGIDFFKLRPDLKRLVKEYL
jgi:transcriptional regulator with XRE-family HTH domain